MKLADEICYLKKKTPCPNCVRNLNFFQDKVKGLETKLSTNERSRDIFISQNIQLTLKTQELFEENQELKAKLRELSCKPSIFQNEMSQVRIADSQDTWDHIHRHSNPQHHLREGF